MSESLLLTVDELKLIENYKKPATKLGFCVLLKHLQLRGCFPREHRELPLEVVSNIADQLECSGKLLQKYDLAGKNCRKHRSQIKEFLGFRDFVKEDRRLLQKWLCDELTFEHGLNDFISEAESHLLTLCICAPSQQQIERIAKSALNQCEEEFFHPFRIDSLAIKFFLSELV